MLLPIGCILLGIPVGWLLRNVPLAVRTTNALAAVVIYILLFLLGAGVGGNKALLAKFSDLGGQGLCIGLCCAVGSVLVTILVQRFFIGTGTKL